MLSRVSWHRLVSNKRGTKGKDYLKVRTDAQPITAFLALAKSSVEAQARLRLG